MCHGDDLCYADVSQTIGRAYSSCNEEIPCFTEIAKFYSMKRKIPRPILGVEALLIHGATLPWIQKRLCFSGFVAFSVAACISSTHTTTHHPISAPIGGCPIALEIQKQFHTSSEHAPHRSQKLAAIPSNPVLPIMVQVA